MHQNSRVSEILMKVNTKNEVNGMKKDKFNEIYNVGNNELKRSNTIKMNSKEQELDTENKFAKEIQEFKETN